MDKQAKDRFWESKKRTLLGYEAGSGTYDRLYGEEQKKKYECCSRYTSRIEGKLILDCGCGTGTWLSRLSGQRGYLVGIDCSRAMLKIAQKRVRRAKDIDLVRADADNLPFKPATFDQVWSFTMLGNMPELGRTLCEIAYVTKDSADAVLSFAKKNVEMDEVLRLMEEASIRVREFIDDENLKDWIAVGEKTRKVGGDASRHMTGLKSLL